MHFSKVKSKIKKAHSSKRFLMVTRGGDKKHCTMQVTKWFWRLAENRIPCIISLIIFNKTVIYTLKTVIYTLSGSLNRWRNGPWRCRYFIWEISSPNQLNEKVPEYLDDNTSINQSINRMKEKRVTITKTLLTMRKNFVTASLSYLASFAACRHIT